MEPDQCCPQITHRHPTSEQQHQAPTSSWQKKKKPGRLPRVAPSEVPVKDTITKKTWMTSKGESKQSAYINTRKKATWKISKGAPSKVPMVTQGEINHMEKKFQ